MLKNNEPQEQLEFLKREEVRTMAKDVAFLREAEAVKERERIVSLHKIPPSMTKTESQLIEPERPVPPSLMPNAKDLPAGRKGQKPVSAKARTRFEKILIRVIIIGVLLFILLNGIAFGYWYFTKKRVVEITPPPSSLDELGTTEGQAVPDTKEPVVQPSPVPSPAVFFETLQEKTIELGEADDLLLLVSSLLKEEHPVQGLKTLSGSERPQGFTPLEIANSQGQNNLQGQNPEQRKSLTGFTRIFLKSAGGSTFLTTREFLARTSLVMPEPLLSLLKEDFMLFLFSSPAKKRLGFVGELAKTEGVQDMLKTWEPTMEQDVKLLWGVVGQKGSAYVPFFRQTSYKDILVRFQTFSAIDFGIVYALYGSNLILTTSFEGMTAAVDLLIQSRP